MALSNLSSFVRPCGKALAKHLDIRKLGLQRDYMCLLEARSKAVDAESLGNVL
jgi:hypothetical protein